MDRTEQQLRCVAGACLTQAQALYQEACGLTHHERDPRSATLAVRGIDAVVNAVAYTLAALNQQAGVLLPQAIEALLPDEILQECAALGEGEAMEPGEVGDVMAVRAGAPHAAGNACQATLIHLTRQALVPSSPHADWEATDALGTLAGLLRTFSGLLDVLVDDHHWRQFTETMYSHARVTQPLSRALG